MAWTDEHRDGATFKRQPTTSYNSRITHLSKIHHQQEQKGRNDGTLSLVICTSTCKSSMNRSRTQEVQPQSTHRIHFATKLFWSLTSSGRNPIIFLSTTTGDISYPWSPTWH